MTARSGDLHVDVAVIGGGPAGLSAATHLRAAGVGDVLIIEREHQAGGIPRHSQHTGYGIRDLHRVLNGPAYAAELVARAEACGARILTGAMATGWSGPLSLDVTSPSGVYRVHARAVIIATGARERPRTARMVAGDRPSGVYTTGQLQNATAIWGQHPGSRAVIVGAELVSWSAVMTLRHHRCHVALMTTQYARAESYAAMTLPGRLLLGVRVATRTQVVQIIGKDRVQAVRITHLDSGKSALVPCDTVVFTGDWIADNELARAHEVAVDPTSSGIIVDAGLRTSAAGVFAIGNVVHPVDTADVAALDGVHVAAQVADYLHHQSWATAPVELQAAGALRWVSPGRIDPSGPAPARSRLLGWGSTVLRTPTITVEQGGICLSRQKLVWPMSPGRAFRMPWSILANVHPSRGPATITVA